MQYTNGNGGASAAKRLSGRSLAHCQLDARQRACLAAAILLHEVEFDASIKQMASTLGVSVPYVMTAIKLSPQKRNAIASGRDTTSFAARDKALTDTVKVVGVDRAIASAVEAESHYHQ